MVMVCVRSLASHLPSSWPQVSEVQHEAAVVGDGELRRREAEDVDRLDAAVHRHRQHLARREQVEDLARVRLRKPKPPSVRRTEAAESSLVPVNVPWGCGV